MNRKWAVAWAIVAVVLAFSAGVTLYRKHAADQAPDVNQMQRDALVRAHSPVLGNPRAPVTIVEFFDPACETCRAFHPIVKQIVNANFGRVRLVLRYAPLHEGSDTAVKILEAARLQDRYWQALEQVLATQPGWASHQNPRPELIWGSLEGIGLDIGKARSDVTSPAINEILRQDVADMRTLGVDRTPGFFVNGRPLREFGESQLRSLVASQVAATSNQ
jgi:protein-disulfide isomerase